MFKDIPKMKDYEAWASGFQWGLILVITTATMPGDDWAAYVWGSTALLSCIPAGLYMARVGKHLRQAASTKGAGVES